MCSQSKCATWLSYTPTRESMSFLAINQAFKSTKVELSGHPGKKSRLSAIDNHRKPADGACERFINQLFRKGPDVPDIFKNIQLGCVPKIAHAPITKSSYRVKSIGQLSQFKFSQSVAPLDRASSRISNNRVFAYLNKRPKVLKSNRP